MLALMNIYELQMYIASKIKKERISQNMTQKEIAQKANIPLSTYRRFEQKGEGSMKDFLKILTVLKRVGDLEHLLRGSEYSPVAEYEALQKQKKEKKRVRHGT